jgi:hypothetical protein
MEKNSVTEPDRKMAVSSHNAATAPSAPVSLCIAGKNVKKAYYSTDSFEQLNIFHIHFEIICNF